MAVESFEITFSRKNILAVKQWTNISYGQNKDHTLSNGDKPNLYLFHYFKNTILQQE